MRLVGAMYRVDYLVSSWARYWRKLGLDLPVGHSLGEFDSACNGIYT